MATRPPLLFLSPVMPDESGNGLAMRAGLYLRALSLRYALHLIVIPVFGTAAGDAPSVCVEETCDHVRVRADWVEEDPLYRMIATISNPSHRLAALTEFSKPAFARFAGDRADRDLTALHAVNKFSAVHVVRLYLAPYAAPFLGLTGESRPSLWLDCDDYESATQDRLADLSALNCDEQGAHLQRAEAEKYRALESDYLPRFDLVHMASAKDIEMAAQRHPDVSFCHVSNATRLPRHRRRRPPAVTPFTLLFVGTMSYQPNVDAVCFFCDEILPRLADCGFDACRFIIAGTNPAAAVRALGFRPSVTVTGGFDDIEEIYAAADLAVVPLRAGGGTRIKIIEAFAQGCPVVATALGAEGLSVSDGEHLLVGDTAAAFAQACARLLRDTELADRLAANSFELVRRRYDFHVVTSQIQAITAAS